METCIYLHCLTRFVAALQSPLTRKAAVYEDTECAGVLRISVDSLLCLVSLVLCAIGIV
jgi:hypothetical protein